MTTSGRANKQPAPPTTGPAGPDVSLRAFFPQLAGLAVAVLALPALAQTPAAEGARPKPGADAIAVLFPDIGEPLRKVFTEMIEGIEEQLQTRVRGYPIAANQDMQELGATIKRSGTKVIVALGRQGLKAAASVEAPLGIVVSGISSLPDGDRQIGIYLTPDPALLFAQLRSLVPTSRRVMVVYNPAQNEWLVKLAREAARTLGLELVAFEARDLASAARLYEVAFASADGKRDALWLPTDATTVDEATIMPIVLRESWNRNVPIFSHSLTHVRRGVLFALYPNNVELGRNLGALAAALAGGTPPARGVTPLREVHTALNLRTAGHIGITVAPRLQRSFHYVYPEP